MIKVKSEESARYEAGSANKTNSIRGSRGARLHSRVIDIATYECAGEEERIVVEGTLRDERCQETYVPNGEKFPRGVIHHMAVRLLVNCSTFVIEEIEVDLLHVPREICRETRDCLAPLKGMRIAKGFTAKVKSMVGGVHGCTHLVELLLAMAPAVIQGYAAYRTRKPPAPDADHSKMYLRLVNTCHVWREDGPIVEQFRRLEKRSEKLEIRN